MEQKETAPEQEAGRQEEHQQLVDASERASLAFPRHNHCSQGLEIFPFPSPWSTLAVSEQKVCKHTQVTALGNMPGLQAQDCKSHKSLGFIQPQHSYCIYMPHTDNIDITVQLQKATWLSTGSISTCNHLSLFNQASHFLLTESQKLYKICYAQHTTKNGSIWGSQKHSTLWEKIFICQEGKGWSGFEKVAISITKCSGHWRKGSMGDSWTGGKSGDGVQTEDIKCLSSNFVSFDNPFHTKEEQTAFVWKAWCPYHAEAVQQTEACKCFTEISVVLIWRKKIVGIQCPWGCGLCHDWQDKPKIRSLADYMHWTEVKNRLGLLWGKYSGTSP